MNLNPIRFLNSIRYFFGPLTKIMDSPLIRSMFDALYLTYIVFFYFEISSLIPASILLKFLLQNSNIDILVSINSNSTHTHTYYELLVNQISIHIIFNGRGPFLWDESMYSTYEVVAQLYFHLLCLSIVPTLLFPLSKLLLDKRYNWRTLVRIFFLFNLLAFSCVCVYKRMRQYLRGILSVYPHGYYRR